MIGFRARLPLAQRIAMRCAALARRPDHLPVILERGTVDTPWLDREKFLLQRDVTVAMLLAVVRRRLEMSPAQSLFLTTRDSVLLGAQTLLLEVYQQHRDREDGFLYLRYAVESTFG